MAKQRIDIISTQGTACGSERITVTDSTAVGITPPAGALYALASVEADNTSADKFKAVRWLADKAPTASEGHILPDAAYVEFYGSNLYSLKFIGIEAGKSHSVQLSYYC